MNIDIFKDLNDSQQEAVRSTEGRVRVVAGAGAGKTKTLAARYAFIVSALGIDPANILCLTFTNKAAKEMTQRIAKLVDKGNYSDFVCTIHGFCVKFLRAEIYHIGFPKSFTIIDVEDQKQIAHQVLDHLGVDKSVKNINSFLSGIAGRKSTGGYVETYLTQSANKIDVENCRDEFELYIAMQLKLFALDFDDLIHLTLYILHAFPEVLAHWQQELNYVMIDEAQDCNTTDWNLVELLSAGCGNLFIVGDPDQAIYEWRGSDPGYFVKFEADKDIVLNRNYRSTQGILDVANSVIKHNKNRIDKDLYTKKDAGPSIVHFHAASEQKEAEWIVKQIKKKMAEGDTNASDFAVLYRASYLSRFIEQNLMKHNIPYQIWGGIRFFERKEIKDALSYLRLIAADDDLSFLRICNVPARKMGKSTVSALQDLAQKEQKSLFETLCWHRDEQPFKKEPIAKFIDNVNDWRSKAPYTKISQLLESVLKESGLKDEIRTDGDDDRLQNVLELVSSVKYYEDTSEEAPNLVSYLQDVALYTNADYTKETDSVKLMTIHQSKGLEFPHVFVVGLSDGIFPSLRAIRERKNLAEEEERRLMYVAVTRAEKTLMLTESEGYNAATQAEKYPSRFLLEIKRELFVTEGKMDPILWENTKRLAGEDNQSRPLFDTVVKSDYFHEGDLVRHEIFGDGVVVSTDQSRDTVNVKFENGNRNLRPSFIKKISDIENSLLN